MSTKMGKNCRNFKGEAKRWFLQKPSDTEKIDARKEIFQINVEYEGRTMLTVRLRVGDDASLLHETMYTRTFLRSEVGEEVQGL